VFSHAGIRQRVQTKLRAVREIYFCAAAPRSSRHAGPLGSTHVDLDPPCCCYRVAGDLGLDLQPNWSERAIQFHFRFERRTKRVAISLLPLPMIARPRHFLSRLHYAYIRLVSVATKTARALSSDSGKLPLPYAKIPRLVSSLV